MWRGEEIDPSTTRVVQLGQADNLIPSQRDFFGAQRLSQPWICEYNHTVKISQP